MSPLLVYLLRITSTAVVSWMVLDTGLGILKEKWGQLPKAVRVIHSAVSTLAFTLLVTTILALVWLA